MHFILKLLLGMLVSFYLFPFGLTFLPASINTKAFMAVFGAITFFFDHLPITRLKIRREFTVSFFIASLFSIVCLFSVDYNNTDDYSYASYLSSFFVWIFGAYFVGWVFRRYYGEFSLRILGYYLLGVCFTQCVLALIIDYSPAFKAVVDAYVFQGQEFLNRIDRLYGIGASLDPAGVRFSVVLIVVAGLLANDQYLRRNKLALTLVIIAYFFVAVVGNMISRTATVGFVIGLVYFIYASGLFRLIIRSESIKLGIVFGLVLIGVVSISLYLYNTNQEFYEDMRFAFEGFFNLAETGEWRTDSTDKLNNEMWIWPEDTKTWVIGSGLFGNFVYSTDIGYCRFILYCGLIGFSVFAILFVYNAIAFMIKVPTYSTMFLLLGVLTFIIWLKVATDIFFIYALFYFVDVFEYKENDLEEVIMSK